MQGNAEKQPPLELFYCYAREDTSWRDQLDKHLSALKRLDNLRVWYDGNIIAGTVWEDEIKAHLNSANIVVLLVSSDFLASDYCYSIEMQRALERHAQKTARVIPIIIRPVDWHGAPFSHLQILPERAKPVTRWSNIDDAFENVAKEIRKAAKDLRDVHKLQP